MYNWPKKAPRVGVFFVLVVWLAPAGADTCAPPQHTEPVKVRYVTDGDTLVLGDNRKIRLIGVNTPELARKEKPAQPMAIRARDRLRQLLFQHGNRARLLYGEQQTDRYGRKLANLWLPDDSNLTAELLREGLGWMIAIPPNTRFLDCYQQAEKTARATDSGVWHQPGYAVKNSAQLGLRSTGFQRVQGRIVRVNQGGGATWVNLQGRFALRIPDQDIRWFSNRPNRSWVGRTIEVRGWAYAKKGELRMSVHHPAMLRFID
ncbi:MAG TPA: thermonuclease family protein [Gammaproteobacteria bacterium]|nr:thermonuclease family protein [Gammaproteobacteria bacterium]